MSERLDEFPAATQFALITFASRGAASAYRRKKDIAYPVLIDVDRESYRAFGLGRGSVWRVWGVKALRRYVELIRRDGLTGLRRPTDDTLQLGGDFVVAPDGTLARGFWGEGPDDRPTVDQLIEAAAQTVTPT